MTVAENLASVRARIDAACARVGRDPAAVTLVAVSKTHPPTDIETAIAAGQVDFGENYVQELRDKADRVRGAVRWHYIGHLQTNKVKYIAPGVHLVHTVDNEHLANELDRRAAQNGRRIAVLLQVNVAQEEAKSGCHPDDLESLAAHLLDLENLDLRGLMTMPPFWPAERVRPFFAQLRGLRDSLQAKIGTPLPDLSMGMTADFEVAVEEGATLVRVGTAIFGARD